MTSVAGDSALCAYCGLPVAGVPAEEPELVFCCFGCRFADTLSRERDDETVARWTLTRLGLSIFFTMNVMVFTMALWSRDIYGSDGGELSASVWELFRYLCLLFTLPVVAMLGIPLADHAWQNLRRGRVCAELLIVAGVLAAFVFSALSVLTGGQHVYFEVACMVLVLVTLGRWLEASGRHRATTGLDRLQRLLPDEVAVIRGDSESCVGLGEVRPGDVLRVRAGERFAADGVIESGITSVDEQVYSGEGLPQQRGPGDAVAAGSLNVDGDVRLKVTAAPGEGTFARLLEVLRSARLSRGRYQRLADQIARYFVPAVAVLAIVVFWWHLRSGAMEALMAALSVVLIACPCALGLATPLAVWTGLSEAADHQVLFRNGESLERLAGLSAVRFDKTGTLTTGTPRVAEVVRDPATDSAEVDRIGFELSSASNHVFSVAITRMLAGSRTPVPQTRANFVANLRTVPGQGICGTGMPSGQTSQVARLGSVRFASEQGQAEVPESIAAALRSAELHGRASVVLSWAGRVRAVFLIDEELRPEAGAAVESLQAMGLDVAVLTGDRADRAARWADILEVPVLAGLDPAGKVDHIRATQTSVGPVAMVGDGINDAPALAASDVGIALGCGADITRDSAAVCVTSDDLTRVPWAIGLARRTRRVVRQNLAWAFGYNTVGIVLAASGRLNPAIAAGLMLASSVIVIVNSLRLSGYGGGISGGSEPAGEDVAAADLQMRAPSPAAAANGPVEAVGASR